MVHLKNMLWAAVGVVIGVGSMAGVASAAPAASGDDPQSDGNRIFKNFVRGNGTMPVADPLLDAFRADLSWDGTGNDNCWKANDFDTSVPPALPPC